ncbi:hypothetical protein HD554DRAFT_307348 [Boletus coccyginus]|nr:hypothetical protein HD554DRAFT_307348 [Boletus coccyginus]
MGTFGTLVRASLFSNALFQPWVLLWLLLPQSLIDRSTSLPSRCTSRTCHTTPDTHPWAYFQIGKDCVQLYACTDHLRILSEDGLPTRKDIERCSCELSYESRGLAHCMKRKATQRLGLGLRIPTVSLTPYKANRRRQIAPRSHIRNHLLTHHGWILTSGPMCVGCYYVDNAVLDFCRQSKGRVKRANPTPDSRSFHR